MRTKKHHIADLCVADARQEQEGEQEIDTFLRALRSYPDRFAREPYLSFQQHLSSILTAAQQSTVDK